MTTTTKRGRPALTTPHRCAICGSEFRRGGRVNPTALCPMHYARERRGSPRAADPARAHNEEPLAGMTIHLTPGLIERLTERARLLGCSRSVLASVFIRTGLDEADAQ